MSILRNCLICGRDFSTYANMIKRGYGKFCSSKCYGATMRDTKRPEEIKKRISETLCKLNRNNPKIIASCNSCKKKFKTIKSKLEKGGGKYCSRKCTVYSHAAWNKGIIFSQIRGLKHWNWQGGKSLVGNAIRRSNQYKEWRMEILRRDEYTCKLCGYRGRGLHVDHYPESFSYLLRKLTDSKDDGITLWDKNNARTLCRKCHEKTDNYGSKSIKRKTHILIY